MCQSTAEKEYISVTVHNPTIHNTYEEGRYTTFDVELQTNSLSFTAKHSVVKRRYSDFQWLRKVLARTTGGSPPSLPFGRLFGTFAEDFLFERQSILTSFMQKLVQDTLFISSSALHLFLQTELSRKDMDSVIKEAKRRGSMNAVSRAISLYGHSYNHIGTCHSVASLAEGGTSFYDNTTSQSLPNFGGIMSVHEAMSTSGSSISDLSTSIHHECFSKGSKFNPDLPAECSSSIGHSDSAEEGYGDWVVIEDSSQASRSLLNHCSTNVTKSAISSESYTKVSWAIGDLPTSLEKRTRLSLPSDNIPVPMNYQLKKSVVRLLTTQSLDSVTDFFCGNSESKSCRQNVQIRQVASESNITDQYLSSPPVSFLVNCGRQKHKPKLDCKKETIQDAFIGGKFFNSTPKVIKKQSSCVDEITEVSQESTLP